MSLTANQQRRLQQTQPQLRQQKAQAYRQQNMQNRPGFFNGRRNIPFSSTPNFNGWLRSSNNNQNNGYGSNIPAFTRQFQPNFRNNQSASTRGTQLLPPPVPTIASQEAGTSIIAEVSIQNNKMFLYMQTIHPRSIAALRPFTDLYQEWAIHSIQYRFVSTAPSVSSGTVVVGFLSNSDPTPSTLQTALQIPNAKITATHTSSGWVNVPPNKAHEHWYHNIVFDVNNQEMRHPGWFLIAATSANTIAAGYVEVKYNVKFRIKKTANATHNRNARHLDIQPPLLLGAGDIRSEPSDELVQQPLRLPTVPGNPATNQDDINMDDRELPNRAVNLTTLTRATLNAQLARLIRHPPSTLTATQFIAIGTTLQNAATPTEMYNQLVALGFNRWRVSYAMQDAPTKTLMETRRHALQQQLAATSPMTEAISARIYHLRNQKPSNWYTAPITAN